MATRPRMIAGFLGCLLLSLQWAAEAQQSKILPAPIPSQIVNARRIFVTNGGGDEFFQEEPRFSGGPDRAYNQFYAALKSSGRYDLVAAPSDADLLIELRLTLVPVVQVFKGDSIAYPYDPQFRLEIRDPKTNALLWALTEHAQGALLKGNRDKNLDLALNKVVGEVQRLTGPAPTDDTRK